MSHYEDLSRCDYFGSLEAPLVAIGWLSREKPYSRGRVTRSFFERLMELAHDAWQPFVVAGLHRCEFCVFTGGPARILVNGISVQLGEANIFVPGAEGIFVAPSLVLHYIDAHDYEPPPEFQQAVENSPPMRSMEYFKMLRSKGLGLPPRQGKTESE